MASTSALSLLPPSPIPSAAHSRSPIEVPHLLAPSSSFLSTNSSVTSSGTTTRTQLPTNQDWWKWATPTIDLAAKSLASPTGDVTGIEMNMARTGAGEGDSGFVGTKEGRKDGKMVGDWRLGQALGSGMSGRVRIARSTITGQFAAIKLIKKPADDVKKSLREAADREIVILKLVEHPNVLRLLDVYKTPDHTYLVTEYCAGGELYQYVAESKLSKPMVHRLFTQLIKALSHLHRMSIAHRDIKLENILVVPVAGHSGQLDLKLADLGMAAFQAPGKFLETSCGSPHYASPEVITGNEYDGPTADIWSAGIILYALVSGMLPFDDDNVPVLLGKIRAGRYEMRKSIQGDARDLIAKMLVVNPAHRIKMSEVHVHPFLVEGGNSPYTFVDAELPFPLTLKPLSPEFALPASRDEVDAEVMGNLMSLCRNENLEDIYDSLFSAKLTKARVFYTILKNYRTRPYSSVQERQLLIAAAAAIVANNKSIRIQGKSLHKKARRASSVPSFSAAGHHSSPIHFAGFINCDYCHSPTIIPPFTAPLDRMVHSNTHLPLIEVDEVTPEGEENERDDDLLTMLQAGLITYSPTASTMSTSSPKTFVSQQIRHRASDSNIGLEPPPSPLGESRRGISEGFRGLFGKSTSEIPQPKSPLLTSILKRSDGYPSLKSIFLPSLTDSTPQSKAAATRLPLSPIENTFPLSRSNSRTTRTPISDFFASSNLFKNSKKSQPVVNTVSQSPSLVASLQKSYFSDYDSPSTDVAQLVISMPASPTPVPSGNTIKRRPSPLDLADIKNPRLDLEIQTARSDISTTHSSYTPNIPAFAWSPSAIQHRSIDVRNSHPLCHSPAPTTASSFGHFIMHSPRHQSDIRFGPQSPSPATSPRLVDELRKEVANLSNENQSLSLENQLLREALDIDQGGNVVAELMERMSENTIKESLASSSNEGENEKEIMKGGRNFLGAIDAGKEKLWAELVGDDGITP